MTRKILQSRDVSKVLDVELGPPSPRVPGPQTGAELHTTPGQWLERNATRSELESFAAQVRARQAAAGEDEWLRLPSGIRIKSSMLLGFCPSCRHFCWVKELDEKTVCPNCNYRADLRGPILRLATASERKRYFQLETAAARRRAADAPKAKAALNDFNRRQIEQLPRDRQGRL